MSWMFFTGWLWEGQISKGTINFFFLDEGDLVEEGVLGFKSIIFIIPSIPWLHTTTPAFCICDLVS